MNKKIFKSGSFYFFQIPISRIPRPPKFATDSQPRQGQRVYYFCRMHCLQNYDDYLVLFSTLYFAVFHRLCYNHHSIQIDTTTRHFFLQSTQILHCTIVFQSTFTFDFASIKICNFSRCGLHVHTCIRLCACMHVSRFILGFDFIYSACHYFAEPCLKIKAVSTIIFSSSACKLEIEL